MMAAIKRALNRFGGASLLSELPSVDFRMQRGVTERAEINARLEAIRVETDVLARNARRQNGG